MNQRNIERKRLESIEEQIVDIISTVSGKVIDSGVDGLQEVNLDSLSKLEILTLLEERFNLSITEESAKEFTSISSISRIVLRSMDAQRSDLHDRVS